MIFWIPYMFLFGVLDQANTSRSIGIGPIQSNPNATFGPSYSQHTSSPQGMCSEQTETHSNMNGNVFAHAPANLARLLRFPWIRNR